MGYPGILVDDAGFGQKAKRECAVMKGTAPLSKTYRTCHKPEVVLILLSNRFENLPKSSGHGNGIAAFLARCFLLSRITRQLIVAFRSSSWGTYRLKRCRCSPLPNAFRFSHTIVNAPVV